MKVMDGRQEDLRRTTDQMEKGIRKLNDELLESVSGGCDQYWKSEDDLARVSGGAKAGVPIDKRRLKSEMG